jgi:hypothetical protein
MCRNRETATHAALENGDLPTLQALLKAGADANQLDKCDVWEGEFCTRYRLLDAQLSACAFDL